MRNDKRIPPKARLLNLPEARVTNPIGKVLDRSRGRLGQQIRRREQGKPA
jgi:hypothetical protein